jgi:hypothetical protein
MKTLEEKIEKMLSGEKKRREIAIEWLEKKNKDRDQIISQLIVK